MGAKHLGRRTTIGQAGQEHRHRAALGGSEGPRRCEDGVEGGNLISVFFPFLFPFPFILLVASFPSSISSAQQEITVRSQLDISCVSMNGIKFNSLSPPSSGGGIKNQGSKVPVEPLGLGKLRKDPS